jgi:hypothetical protein
MIKLGALQFQLRAQTNMKYSRLVPPTRDKNLSAQRGRTSTSLAYNENALPATFDPKAIGYLELDMRRGSPTRALLKANPS